MRGAEPKRRICGLTVLRGPCSEMPRSFTARHKAQRRLCASAMRLRPSAVLGPVESPPCSRQRRDHGKGRIWQGVPLRVFAPHVLSLRLLIRSMTRQAWKTAASSSLISRPHDARAYCGKTHWNARATLPKPCGTVACRTAHRIACIAGSVRRNVRSASVKLDASGDSQHAVYPGYGLSNGEEASQTSGLG